MKEFITKIVIDDKRIKVLKSYKKNGDIVESDHNIIEVFYP
jgi:hypothetical protein